MNEDIKELTPDQQAAFERFRGFLSDVSPAAERSASLNGAAGTGKTTLVKELAQLAKTLGYDVMYCATTHAAAAVLEESVKRYAYTIHRVLGVGISDSDKERDMTVTNKTSRIRIEPDENDRLLFVDESSMVSKDFYELTQEYIADNPKLRICYIGDGYQLPPIENLDLAENDRISNGGMSWALCGPKVKMVLTTPCRAAYDNPITQAANMVRKVQEDSISWPAICEDINKVVDVIDDYEEFMDMIVQSRQDNKTSIVLTYRSEKQADIMAKEVRRRILGEDNPAQFAIGDIITAQRPYLLWLDKNSHDTYVDKGDVPTGDIESGDVQRRLVIKNNADCKIVRIDPIAKSGVGGMRFYTAVVKLATPSVDGVEHVTVLIPEDMKSFQRALNEKADECSRICDAAKLQLVVLESAEKERQLTYEEYLERSKLKDIIDRPYIGYNTFKSRYFAARHMYATTVHKSQGRQFDEVFVHLQDIYFNKNRMTLLRMIYTAITRAQKKVILYTTKSNQAVSLPDFLR